MPVELGVAEVYEALSEDIAELREEVGALRRDIAALRCGVLDELERVRDFLVT